MPEILLMYSLSLILYNYNIDDVDNSFDIWKYYVVLISMVIAWSKMLTVQISWKVIRTNLQFSSLNILISWIRSDLIE